MHFARIYPENIFVHYYLPSARSSFLPGHIPPDGEGNRGKDSRGVRVPLHAFLLPSATGCRVLASNRVYQGSL